ncbi:MAG TPA: hypothetical protein DDZ89_16065 [Clostridiales bacterium]|nr:hypothetical protein [Clostridiales bacterium]
MLWVMQCRTATQDSMYHIDQMDKINTDGSKPWSTSRNLCWILWGDHLMKPVFDIIRITQRFTKCFDFPNSNSHVLY